MHESEHELRRELSDEDIVRKVQKGDTEEFGALIGRYEAKLARYARRFLLNGDEAKDLLQDVFIKAYVNIQSFNPERRFSPWIYRIAHNECVNVIKKKKALRFTFSLVDFDVLLPHPPAKERADDAAQRGEMKRAVEEFLGKLDVKYRAPLALYYLEDMSYDEIADVLKVPVSTVGVRLQRGKALLKKLNGPAASDLLPKSGVAE